VLSSKLGRSTDAYLDFLVISGLAKPVVQDRDCLFEVFRG